jgi:hypothetical protein
LLKLLLWKRRLISDNYANFPVLEEVFSQAGVDSLANFSAGTNSQIPGKTAELF